MGRRRVLICVAFTLLAGPGMILADETTAADSQVLPRYKLEPGQQLEYEGEGEFSEKNSTRRHSLFVKISVLQQSDDGSWDLFLSRSMRYGTSKPRVSAGGCRFFPDGRLEWLSGYEVLVEPRDFLIPIPATVTELEKGWTWTSADGETTRELRSVPGAAADTLTIDVERGGLMDDVYETTVTSRATFDLVQGLVRTIESKTTQNYGVQGEGKRRLELKAMERLDEETTRTLLADVQRYQQSVERGDKLEAEAVRAGDQADEILDRVAKLSREAADAISTPEVKDLAEEYASQWELESAYRKYVLEQSQNNAKLTGQMSPAWEAVDLQGQSLSPESLRGRVVVMDFWYRGCGWCIRAMPQVRKISETFADQPVTLLGMNTDKDEADARFVVDRLQLKYPTVKAEGIPEKYGVKGFPTLVILDKQGRIRDFHIGFSPTLHNDVAQEIRKLLAETD